MLKFSVQHQKLPLGLSYPNKLCFFSLMDKRVEPKLKKLNPPKQKLQLHFHHARASSLPFPPNTEFICYQNATPHTWTIEQPSGLFLWSYDPPFLESPQTTPSQCLGRSPTRSSLLLPLCWGTCRWCGTACFPCLTECWSRRPWCWLPTPNLQHIGWFYQIELGYYRVNSQN